jgi:hypothetical protein
MRSSSPARCLPSHIRCVYVSDRPGLTFLILLVPDEFKSGDCLRPAAVVCVCVCACVCAPDKPDLVSSVLLIYVDFQSEDCGIQQL